MHEKCIIYGSNTLLQREAKVFGQQGIEWVPEESSFLRFLGKPTWRQYSIPKKKHIFVTEIKNQEDFVRLLNAAPDGIVEVDDSGRWRKCLDRIRDSSWDVEISLTALTAYQIPVSTLIGGTFFNGDKAREEAVDEIRSCLHEAVSNAVLHGCLGLGLEKTSGLKDFEHYYARAETRLAFPEFAQKRVMIRMNIREDGLLVEVEDEGEGYDFQGIEKMLHTSLMGRGLYIIHEYSKATIHEGGRCIRIHFSQIKNINLSKDNNKEPASNKMQNARILLADDNEFSLRLLSEVLSKSGFKNLCTAGNGEEALQKTHEFKPDIVLLDMMMPKLSGFDYCKKIREDKAYAHMPILVITALDEPMEKARAFEVGATDLINKPFGQDEFIARLKVHLENQALLKDLEQYKERTSRELSVAKEMQALLLPSSQMIEGIMRRYGVKVGAHFESSLELGGDFWGLIPIDDKKFSAYIIDFSGHGVAAALNTFRLHAVLEQESKESLLHPGKLLQAINQKLYQLLPTGQFATMLYGIIDVAEGKFTYAAAGSTEPLLIESPGKILALDSQNVPLGVAENSQYDEKTVPIGKGATLFFYSDALIESKNEEGKFFNQEELLEYVSKAKNKDEEVTLLDDVVDAVHQHAGEKLKDDLTAFFVAMG